MSDHLDLDALADALDDPSAPHLAGCADCAARLDELRAASASVTATLAALPDPPLPAGLADRLAAAVAAEPPLAPARSATVVPLAPRRRAWLPAAAAAAVLVLGGALGVSALSGGSGQSSDTAASGTAGSLDSGGAVADEAPRSDSGTDYADDASLAASLPAVLAGTAQLRSAEDAAVAAAPPAAGGTTFSTSAAPETSDLQVAAAPDPLARLRDPAGLASCLAALLPPEEPDLRPLALDYATFAGSPALAVVLPDPDPAKLAVYVVGPQCSQEDDGVLRFVRVGRP